MSRQTAVSISSGPQTDGNPSPVTHSAFSGGLPARLGKIDVDNHWKVENPAIEFSLRHSPKKLMVGCGDILFGAHNRMVPVGGAIQKGLPVNVIN